MNENFITIEGLRERASAWDSQLSDEFAMSPEIGFMSPMGIAYIPEAERIDGLFSHVGSVATNAGLTEHAFSQLCGRLHVPGSWAQDDEKCPPELRKILMDWKLANNEPKRFMMRLRENGGMVARAIMSDQYSPYNHLEFVDAIADAFGSQGVETKIWRPEVGDEFRCYALMNQIDFGNGYGGRQGGTPSDDRGGAGGLHPAVYFSNSEIGTGRVRVASGLYRSWCENGMILGWKADESLSVIHRGKTQQHMALLVNEAIVGAMKMTEEAAHKFLDLRAVKLLPSKVGNVIDNWASKYGITVEAKDAWASRSKIEIEDTGLLTLFGLINQATYAASHIENPETRETMERMAGDMVYASVPQGAVFTNSSFAG